MAKDEKLTVDEENAEKAKYAGMLKSDIISAASAIATHKTKSAELSGDLSGKLTVFDKKGGHKKALKLAQAICSMEPTEVADFIRAFDAYFDALGGNAQLDMFTQDDEKRKNADSVAVASKTVVAKPSMGLEAVN